MNHEIHEAHEIEELFVYLVCFVVYPGAISSKPRIAAILLVEDDPSMRKVIADYLSENFSCVATGSAEEAMEVFQTIAFNLVLTDMSLPGADGLELCRFVRARHPYTQVILMSASARVEIEIEAARQRVFEYLSKPFLLSRLDRAISRALRYQTLSKELSRVRKPVAARAAI